tara:strand:- start:21 stop:389 length:369 start_codon:yes stop_codon:yes gene_type:complete
MTTKNKDNKPNKPNTKKRDMLKALNLTCGNVSEACAKVNISRWTHYDWLKTDDEYKREAKEIEEANKDWVEGKIRQHIENDNPTVTIFYAKTKMRDRGYIESNDMNISISKGTLPEWFTNDE